MTSKRLIGANLQEAQVDDRATQPCLDPDDGMKRAHNAMVFACRGGRRSNTSRDTRLKAKRDDPEGVEAADTIKKANGGRPLGKRSRPVEERVYERALRALMKKPEEWWSDRGEYFMLQVLRHCTPSCSQRNQPGDSAAAREHVTMRIRFGDDDDRSSSAS